MSVGVRRGVCVCIVKDGLMSDDGETTGNNVTHWDALIIILIFQLIGPGNIQK